MGWGDELVAAGQAQRLYEQSGQRVRIIDLAGHPRWHPLWVGNPAIVHPTEVVLPADVQDVQSGPSCRPYIVYPFTKESGWTFNKAFRCRDYPATLYLTDAELARGTRALEQHGPYVLIEPFTKHDNFRWPLERWQALVDACPDLTFVQHTHAESPLLNGVHHEPASFREACGLIASSSAYVRSESGLCHAAAALKRPQVTLFGGCMDADVMGGYPGQITIVDGEDIAPDESPCGRWLPCQHCADAMDRITVDIVKAALMVALKKGTTDGTRDVAAGEGESANHRRREQRHPAVTDRTSQRRRARTPEVASR